MLKEFFATPQTPSGVSDLLPIEAMGIILGAGPASGRDTTGCLGFRRETLLHIIGRCIPRRDTKKVVLKPQVFKNLFLNKHDFAFLKMHPIEFPFKGKRDDSSICARARLHTHGVCAADCAQASFRRYHNIFGLLLGREISILDKNSAAATELCWVHGVNRIVSDC